MKLISNADDYGFNLNAVAAIRKAFSLGVVTNTTGMITMPCFEEALELARHDGFADRIGLHVNLSAGTPLTDGIKKSVIFCDKDGRFNNGIRSNKIWRFWLPASLKPLIADEIRAQMRLFFKFGLTERHYDSHGQVCCYWPILPIALEVGKEFGFRTTRIFINTSSSPTCATMSLARRFYIKHIENCIDRFRYVKTTHLGHAHDLPRMIRTLPDDSTVELMVHPVFRDKNGKMDVNGDLCDWAEEYATSFQQVEDRSRNLELISFNEL